MNRHIFYFELIFLIILFFTGCSTINYSFINSDNSEAVDILRKIESINKDIKTSKGTGWIIITDIASNIKKADINNSILNEQVNFDKENGIKINNIKSKKFRMAWIASFPDKIRLTLLSAGHPVETILADGSTVTFISHTGRHKTKKINSANPSLSDIVAIPVTIQDILSIFAGKTPIAKFDTASIAQITYSPQLTDTMLMLKRRWNGNSQNIILTYDNKITTFSLINGNNKLIHSVFNKEFKEFDSFSIPVKVKIKDNKGREIYFEITTYQPNITVKEKTFVLTDSR